MRMETYFRVLNCRLSLPPRSADCRDPAGCTDYQNTGYYDPVLLRRTIVTEAAFRGLFILCAGSVVVRCTTILTPLALCREAFAYPLLS